MDYYGVVLFDATGVHMQTRGCCMEVLEDSWRPIGNNRM
jgi:hypothetical protein